MIKLVLLCLLIIIALALVAGPGMRRMIAKLLGIRRR
ncbi:hypothetical protein SAMN05421641_104198 [Paracoccus thiocyanatus]|uniref:Uncharacterized protein n=1 Tax=Paracoccus thiocyanatus TaxID=34006 RepID=A0A1N6QR29_9RHOB|nr:hypothetical protein SAMN05421641_104198 [Paracoccus thiocyanatus]